MSREIKFKVWDKINKEVCPPVSSLALTLEGEVSVLTDAGWQGTHYSLGRYDLLQYTGIKDKNGNGIYEGDILEWAEDNECERGIVKFRKGAFYLDLNEYFQPYLCVYCNNSTC
jgi:hypothetical protein